MSNWEPEEVSDADMEDIAGGVDKGEKKKGPGRNPMPKPPGGGDSDGIGKKRTPGEGKGADLTK
jgi:hypothetical protein